VKIKGNALFMEFGALEWDSTRHELRYRNQTVSLTKLELAVLSVLASQSERLVSRKEIRDRVWGSGKKVDLRTIDAHVAHLRKKLRRFKSASVPVIQTVWGLGYRLRHSPSNNVDAIRINKNVNG
jgi:DNA-binding response OmpR family regulator